MQFCYEKVFLFANVPVLHQFVLGEANFLGGVAAVKGVKGFDPEAAKKRFFEIYLDKVNEFCQSSFVILSVYCNKREFL